MTVREAKARTTMAGGVCSPAMFEAPLSGENADKLAIVLTAIADPVRLRLLSILAAHGEVCSCHLEAPLGKSQSTISHHTRILANAGLIEGERRGKWTWWRMVPGQLASLSRILADVDRTR